MTTKPSYVHRRLALTSPLADGPDVHALQEALAALLEHNKIDWLPLNVDGDFGPQTLHACRFLSWVVGLGKGHRKRIKAGYVPQDTQRLLRDLTKRSARERRRAKRRQPRLRKIRAAQSGGPDAAIAGARACIGITESPAGSNSGPSHKIVVRGKAVTVGVSAFEAAWGLGPCYWCLCFASFWAKWAGARISGNCTYSVAIEGYARNHENGWVQVSWGDRRPGDFTIWKFDGPSSPSDHGEMLVEMNEDVGGITSSEGGSQSYGGGVFAKQIG
jgi:hypothetical protein